MLPAKSNICRVIQSHPRCHIFDTAMNDWAEAVAAARPRHDPLSFAAHQHHRRPVCSRRDRDGPRWSVIAEYAGTNFFRGGDEWEEGDSDRKG